MVERYIPHGVSHAMLPRVGLIFFFIVKKYLNNVNVFFSIKYFLNNMRIDLI
jgi:hypothetical protein